MKELNKLTAHELVEKISSKEVVCEDILDNLYKRINKIESKVKAYIRINKTEEPANLRTCEPP